MDREGIAAERTAHCGHEAPRRSFDAGPTGDTGRPQPAPGIAEMIAIISCGTGRDLLVPDT